MKKEKIKIEGFDEAIIGETINNILIYSYEIMIDILCQKQNLNKQEAEDFLEYNTIRALEYIDNAPIIANFNIKPLLLDIEHCNGDIAMRCEIDILKDEIKTLNCHIADCECVNEEYEVFDSRFTIRLQQEDDCFDYYGKPNKEPLEHRE